MFAANSILKWALGIASIERVIKIYTHSHRRRSTAIITISPTELRPHPSCADTGHCTMCHIHPSRWLTGRHASDMQMVAESRSDETFVALCLLTVTGASLLTQRMGFSDTMGAFVAGVLLSETNYRSQVLDRGLIGGWQLRIPSCWRSCWCPRYSRESASGVCRQGSGAHRPADQPQAGGTASGIP